MLRRFFEENAPMTEVRPVMGSQPGLSRGLWKRVCEELGLPGPWRSRQSTAGWALACEELAIALGETGRALAPVALSAVAELAVRAIGVVTLVRRPSSKGRDRQLAPGVPTRFSRRGMRLTANSGRISC